MLILGLKHFFIILHCTLLLLYKIFKNALYFLTEKLDNSMEVYNIQHPKGENEM